MVCLADALLQTIFTFVGGGHYLFIGGVNPQWLSLYRKETKDELGTHYRNSKASLTTMKYACACGLDLAKDAIYLSCEYFGSGVYEWCRKHGSPLVAWVAVWFRRDVHLHSTGRVTGAFSSRDLAKLAAIKSVSSAHNLNPEEAGVSGWEGTWEECTFDVGRRGEGLLVRGFIVKDVTYDKEVELYNSIPMYVFTRTYSGWKQSYEVEEIYASKESANNAMDESIAYVQANGFLGDTAAADASDEDSSSDENDSGRVFERSGLKSYSHEHRAGGLSRMVAKIESAGYLIDVA